MREFLFVSRGGAAAQAALVRERQRTEAGLTRASVVAPEVYTLGFGMHKRRTIASLYSSADEKQRDYIPWLFATASQVMRHHLADLKLALEAEDEWGRTAQRAAALRPGRQLRAIEKKAEVDASVAQGERVHRVIVKMRTLAAEKARREREDDTAGLACLSDARSSSQAVAPAKPRRVLRSTATVANKHCKICGEIGHRQDGCPVALRELEQQARDGLPAPRTSDLYGLDKRLAKVVAHLKYTWVEQRTGVYDARKPRAQERQCVSGHQLCRMSASDMCDFSWQCGLLNDLAGASCKSPKCAEYAEKFGSFSSSGTLGPLRARVDVYEVTKSTSCYRCSTCRRAHTVHDGHPMYSLRDRLDEAVYAWWMFVHNGSLTLTTLHLGRKEDVVRRYFHHAAMICAHDARNRQAHTVFGHRGPIHHNHRVG